MTEAFTRIAAGLTQAKEFSAWNMGMENAPRGRTKHIHRKTKTAKGVEDRIVEEFDPDILWCASQKGQVIRSYWIPASRHHNGYWAGFPVDRSADPKAWQPYVVPTHPDLLATMHTAADLTVAHLGIDDVGGGQ